MRDPQLFRYAVYTTLGAERFNQALTTGTLTFTEGKRWTGAPSLLEEARANSQRVALLVSDGANGCSNLIGWGLLDRVDLTDSGTEVRAAGLRPLKRHRTQELILRETG